MNYYHGRKRPLPTDQEISPPKKPKLAFYLDDLTPVRTVEVTDIADEDEALFLRGYFEHAAGKVSSIWMVNNQDGNKVIRKAFITFVVPEDAARAITEPELFKYTVKQATEMYQPKLESHTFKIEGLNNDCLRKIASYLDLSDIVNLGKSTTRLQAFSHLIFQKKTKFSFGANTGDSSITELNLESALEAMGGHIESVEWRNIQAHQLNYLLKNCTVVSDLKLINPPHILHHPVIKENRTFFRNLETLHLDRSSVFEGPLKEMTSLSSIISLELNDCRNLRGTFLSKWRQCQLKTLKITNCRQIGSDVLIEFLRFKRLVKFSFDRGFTLEQFNGLPSNCLADLEELELSLQSVPVVELQQLRFSCLLNLSHLDLTMTTMKPGVQTRNEIFTAINEIPNLVSLSIRGLLANVSTLNSMRLMNKVRKLRFRNCRVTNEFFESLHLRMPHITELELFDCDNGQYNGWYNYNNGTTFVSWNESICKMITALPSLKHLRGVFMDYKFLYKTIEVQLSMKRPQIEIGVFSYPNDVKNLAEANPTAVKLTLLAADFLGY